MTSYDKQDASMINTSLYIFGAYLRLIHLQQQVTFLIVLDNSFEEHKWGCCPHTPANPVYMEPYCNFGHICGIGHGCGAGHRSESYIYT